MSNNDTTTGLQAAIDAAVAQATFTIKTLNEGLARHSSEISALKMRILHLEASVATKASKAETIELQQGATRFSASATNSAEINVNEVVAKAVNKAIDDVARRINGGA